MQKSFAAYDGGLFEIAGISLFLARAGLSRYT